LKRNHTKNTEMRLLVIRTSAMGDVALLTPVLRGMREQYPDVELVLLTRSAFKPFFSSFPGLELFLPDLNNRHKGLAGIIRLYRDLSRKYEFDCIIDLHNVLRSMILRFLFRLTGTGVKVIDKGRIEKRSLVSGKKKIRLKHSVERYCDVFAKAGFPVQPSRDKWIIPSPRIVLNNWYLSEMQGVLNIGVAPHAKHKLKIWPEENMVSLLRLISENRKCKFWLFGGLEDAGRLNELQVKVPHTVSLAGKLSLDEELVFMSKLDFMIAMDSSNMHMAALLGIKVISIWGGTDPLSGFSAWMQPDHFSIRIPVEDLSCRPCTIYGKGECKRGDFACMNWLTPEIVYEKIEKFVLSDRRS
jgi:ADP-heptose:LPS heptosyltransferase